MQSTTMFNFITRFILILAVSVLFLYPGEIARSLFLALTISGSLALFDILFGSPGNIKAQSKRISEVIAGHNIKTTRDKLGWMVIMTLLPLGSLFVTVVILSIFFGVSAQWIWVIGAVLAIIVFVGAPKLAQKARAKH
ncbi:MAG TPA: hypothetical protein VLA88_00485 [Candidatus Saccharimonadales bacterium]|nr:hypothetical protein [Candidatus Saccharimonadales bacterium]